MKKLTMAVTIALAMIFMLAACGGGGGGGLDGVFLNGDIENLDSGRIAILTFSGNNVTYEGMHTLFERLVCDEMTNFDMVNIENGSSRTLLRGHGRYSISDNQIEVVCTCGEINVFPFARTENTLTINDVVFRRQSSGWNSDLEMSDERALPTEEYEWHHEW